MDLLRQLERQSGVHDFDLLMNVILMMRDMDPEALEMLGEIGPNAFQELAEAAGSYCCCIHLHSVTRSSQGFSAVLKGECFLLADCYTFFARFLRCLVFA